MDFRSTQSDNLRIAFEPDDVEMLEAIKERCGGDECSFFTELLDSTGWTGNGLLYVLRPEDIGALTDSLILTNECERDDEGKITRVGSVWWFPNYMVDNPAELLMETGSVIFMKAH